jgi:hypothetical protein
MVGSAVENGHGEGAQWGMGVLDVAE